MINAKIISRITCMLIFKFNSFIYRFKFPFNLMRSKKLMILNSTIEMSKNSRCYGSLRVIGGFFEQHSNSNVSSNAEIEIDPSGSITIGQNVQINSDCSFSTKGVLIIGNGTTFSKGCNINGNILIGENTLFGPNVFISSGKHHYKLRSKTIREQDADALAFYPKEDVYSKISIGNDCWIGVNSVIMSGVVLGNGVIVGAGSIVTKSFSDYSIIAGVPAKVIGHRI